MINKIITVYGNVQGVGFRFAAINKARYLGMKGFVQNQADGSVNLEAEGKEFNVNEFVKWCFEGPRRGLVQNVSVSDGVIRNYKSFEVRY